MSIIDINQIKLQLAHFAENPATDVAVFLNDTLNAIRRAPFADRLRFAIAMRSDAENIATRLDAGNDRPSPRQVFINDTADMWREPRQMQELRATTEGRTDDLKDLEPRQRLARQLEGAWK